MLECTAAPPDPAQAAASADISRTGRGCAAALLPLAARTPEDSQRADGCYAPLSIGQFSAEMVSQCLHRFQRIGHGRCVSRRRPLEILCHLMDALAAPYNLLSEWRIGRSLASRA